MKKIKKIGLALGGGGARGCAHIGVIKALLEAGIQIDYIAGTSIGSLVGGIFAAGKIDELERILLKTRWQDVVKHFDPVIPIKGLFEGKKIVKLLEKILIKLKIKNLSIPYVAVATDLVTGKEIHIKDGGIINAIRASIAIPGIITPLKLKNRYLIDGGVTNPLPVNVVRKMGADIVIAVDLNHSFLKKSRYSKRNYPKNLLVKWLTPERPNIIDVIESSIFVMEDELTQKNLITHKPDFLIQPNLGTTSIFDFHEAKKLIKEGYNQTKKIIKDIKKMI
jgi:NTE family protein